MADCSLTCGSCGVIASTPTQAVCSCGGQFTDPEQLGGNLIDSLTPCVDAIRNIATALGARQYKVSLIWTRWSGGDRGVGHESIVDIHTIEPTPQVSNLTRIRQDIQSVGMTEDGDVVVTEISPRFTEDFLMGRGVLAPTNREFPRDMNFYWEVTYVSGPGVGIRRRFFPKAAPSKHPTKFEWEMQLARSQFDRNRDGSLP